MKKIFVLFTLCFAVVCGAVGQEDLKRGGILDQPEFMGNIDEYSKKLYGEEADKYLFISTSSEYGASEKASRKDAEISIHLKVIEKVFGDVDGYFEGFEFSNNDADFEAEEIVSSSAFESYYQGVFSKVRFPEIEYLDYKTVFLKNSNGKMRYMTYCYARVPKSCVSEKLLSMNYIDRAINDYSKKTGESVSSDVRERLRELEKGMLRKKASEYAEDEVLEDE